jgi:hypothetical protein
MAETESASSRNSTFISPLSEAVASGKMTPGWPFAFNISFGSSMATTHAACPGGEPKAWMVLVPPWISAHETPASRNISDARSTA